MKTIFSILFALSLSVLTYSQSIDMISFFGGEGVIKSKSMISAPNGDFLVAGTFQDLVDFEPGDGITQLSGASANSEYDSFLGRYNAAGELLWVKEWSLANPPYDARNIVRLFSNGDILLVGHHDAGTVDMDPNAGVQNYTLSDGTCYVLRLTPDGEFISVSGNDGNNVIPFDAQVDNNDNIYITGQFQGATDFDGSAAIANLTASGTSNGFLLKLDASGNYQWARNWGAPSSYVAPTAVEIDFEGNPILTGSFTAPTFDLDPNAGTSFAYNSGGTGTQNGFVCKLDSNGDFIWGGGLGGNEHDIIVTVDSDSEGNIYLGGTFDGSGDMDPMSTVQDLTLIGSNSNSFVIKINPVGETQFVHHFGCIQGVDVHTIHLDAVNNKYWISGFNYPETDFDPGADVFVPNGSAGGFVCSYSLDGEFLMHRYVGSSYSDNILLHMNESGNLYLAETCVSAFTMYHPQGAFVFPTAISGRIILLRISNCLEPLLTSVITDPATIVACSNDEILLTALPENAGNSPMFNWYVNGLLNTVDTDMNNEFSFFANFNGPTISCAVISSLGCADGYPSDPTFVDYEVMETFTPTVFIYPTGHCPNEPFILEAYIENGGASPTFQWYQDGELIPGATDTIYTTIGEEPFTEFTVEVYIEETCATENYLISEVQPIVYASMPNVNIYSLENTVYGIPDASNDYQWLDCNNNLEPISGATNTSYTYTGSGSYALIAYNVYCADTSDCLEVTYIPDNIVESDFFGMTIQPNPSQDFIDISCTRGDSKMNIFIYSSRGELAYNAPWKGLTQQRIDLNTLAPGVYYIQLQSNQGISSKKLIVE